MQKRNRKTTSQYLTIVKSSSFVSEASLEQRVNRVTAKGVNFQFEEEDNEDDEEDRVNSPSVDVFPPLAFSCSSLASSFIAYRCRFTVFSEMSMNSSYRFLR